MTLSKKRLLDCFMLAFARVTDPDLARAPGHDEPVQRARITHEAPANTTVMAPSRQRERVAAEVARARRLVCLPYRRKHGRSLLLPLALRSLRAIVQHVCARQLVQVSEPSVSQLKFCLRGPLVDHSKAFNRSVSDLSQRLPRCSEGI